MRCDAEIESRPFRLPPNDRKAREMRKAKRDLRRRRKRNPLRGLR